MMVDTTAKRLLLLSPKVDSDFKKPEEQLEFYYRTARIYDDLGRDNEAVEAYKTTISIG